MSERVSARTQQAQTSQPAAKESTFLQHREWEQAEGSVLEHWQNNSIAGTFTEPNIGFDFSRVPALAGMARQNRPLLRTQPMVQRAPKDSASGSSSCPTCPEAESTPTSASAEPTAEAAASAPEAAPSPVSAELTEETATPGETASPGLLVEDSAMELAPGQMKKSEFLSQLRAEVCRSVEAALAGTGRTTEDCPYLDHWFDFYGRQNTAQIERAIRRYAPDATNVATASGYISVITQRARQAAETWARTGEITGVPEGVPTTVPGETPTESGEDAATAIGPVMFKAREGGVRASDDPQAIQAELGDGRLLDSGVRSRMESAFGMDFVHVRAHTDTTAAVLSTRMNARAFTVGEHVAFGANEYKPGTLVGDAIIAHELAHVVQQGGGTTSVAPLQTKNAVYNALEEDADKSAIGAVGRLWGGVTGALSNIVPNTIPTLRSGLRLQRCDDCSGGRSRTTPTAATVSFTLQNQTGRSTDPAANARVMNIGGTSYVRFAGTAPAGYTPQVTISAPDNSTAAQYEAGLIQNVLTVQRESFYPPSAIFRIGLSTLPIKDGAPSRSGYYDNVFAENGRGHPGVLERFRANGGTVNLTLPDTPGSGAYVNLSDNSECDSSLAAATLSRLLIHDTFRTWVGTRHRSTGAVTTHHHIDWETNWEANVTVTGGTPTVTMVSRSIDVTEADGDGSPSYVSGGPVPADVITKTCDPTP